MPRTACSTHRFINSDRMAVTSTSSRPHTHVWTLAILRQA